MNSFVETISPAAKNLIEARIDYYTDLTSAALQSMRKLAEVNTQFSRTWLQDSTEALRTALLTPQSAERGMAAIAPSAEAVAQKLQAYQQQLTQVASEFQNNINSVVQQHVPQTTRTATALAEVVTQKAAEQADRQLRAQKAAAKETMDQAAQFANVAAQSGSMAQPASMQSADGSGNKN
ncbi:phasin family protein [Duganella sp. LjRoot269]|jgi:hypothetical protein|uniref:phasin family protein n=1 Tax=Duganella sp. LjRoot269 TaxID=3342305 RepID=UPI003ED14083